MRKKKRKKKKNMMKRRKKRRMMKIYQKIQEFQILLKEKRKKKN